VLTVLLPIPPFSLVCVDFFPLNHSFSNFYTYDTPHGRHKKKKKKILFLFSFPPDLPIIAFVYKKTPWKENFFFLLFDIVYSRETLAATKIPCSLRPMFCPLYSIFGPPSTFVSFFFSFKTKM
jgi:hypothetical protein